MITRTSTGTLTTSGDTLTVDVSDVDDISFNLSSGSVTITLVFEVLVDPSNAATTWTTFAMVDYSSTTTTTAVTGFNPAAASLANSVHAPVVSAAKVRVRVTAGAGPVTAVATTGRNGRS